MTATDPKKLDPHATENQALAKTLPIQIYLGGSFDPVHNSHMAMLAHVHDILSSRLVSDSSHDLSNQNDANISAYFLPTSRSPLKSKTTNPTHRLAMLSLACQLLNEHHSTQTPSGSKHSNDTDEHPSQPPFSICEHEIWQTPPTYTIDTLTHLRLTHPDDSLVFILGADNIASLPKWREGENLIEHAHLWVMPRDEFQSVEDIATLLPDKLKPHVVSQASDLKTATHGCIYIDSHSVKPISSSRIREAIEHHNSDITKSALPHSVYSYIMKNNLYHSG